MWKDGLVSIVVPVYKVEAYLRRCLDSILNQTYTHIEVIVVNDGSPDRSGQIADIFQAADARVRVFHKENGGLSDARNYGVQQVSGAYTMFVDSDDWLERTAIETLVDYSVTYQADVVQSAFYYAYDDRLLVDDRHHAHTDPPLLLKNRALMYELVLNEQVKNFAWGKLYKTRLIHDIPFQKGVLFEDVFWAHQVMHRVSRFLMVHEPLCFYYQRDGSIVAAYTPKHLDMLKGLYDRHAFMECYYPELIWTSYRHILKTSFIHYHLLFFNKRADPDGRYRKALEQDIVDNRRNFKRAAEPDQALSKQLTFFLWHPFCHMGLLGLGKVMRKTGVIKRGEGLKVVHDRQVRREYAVK